MSERPVYVVEDGLVHWAGRSVALTPQEAAVLGVLCKRQPHCVTTERLGMAVWPGQLPARLDCSVAVPIRNMRRKLADWPISIEARHGYGYRLVGEIEVRHV